MVEKEAGLKNPWQEFEQMTVAILEGVPIEDLKDGPAITFDGLFYRKQRRVSWQDGEELYSLTEQIMGSDKLAFSSRELMISHYTMDPSSNIREVNSYIAVNEDSSWQLEVARTDFIETSDTALAEAKKRRELAETNPYIYDEEIFASQAEKAIGLRPTEVDFLNMRDILGTYSKDKVYQTSGD